MSERESAAASLHTELLAMLLPYSRIEAYKYIICERAASVRRRGGDVYPTCTRAGNIENCSKETSRARSSSSNGIEDIFFGRAISYVVRSV